MFRSESRKLIRRSRINNICRLNFKINLTVTIIESLKILIFRLLSQNLGYFLSHRKRTFYKKVNGYLRKYVVASLNAKILVASCSSTTSYGSTTTILKIGKNSQESHFLPFLIECP